MAQARVLKRLNRQKIIIFHDPAAAPSAFPAQYFTTMLFQGDFAPNNASALFARNYTPGALDKVFNNTSSPTHEFTVMNNLYRRYVVMAFDWHLSIISQQAQPMQIVVIPWPHADPPTTNVDANTREGAKSRDIQAQGEANAVVKMSGHVNMAKLFGVKNVTTEEEFWGMNNTSPAFLARLYVVGINLGGTANVSFLNTVKIKIYCKWFDRKDQETVDGGLHFRPTWKARNIKRSSIVEPIGPAQEDVVWGPGQEQRRRIVPVLISEEKNDYEMECL